MSRWLCVAVIIVGFIGVCYVHAKKQLYLIGNQPMGGSGWPGGISCLPAVEMGFKHVNARDDILGDYELNYIWEDTKCNAGIAVNSMYKLLYEEPTKIMVVGAGCSTESEATAQTSPLWNLTQISWASGSPLLSDRTRFPRFFRLIQPESKFNLAFIDLLNKYGWKKIATINEAKDYFSAVMDDLVVRVSAINVTILSQEIFSRDPHTRVENLKMRDARIIFSSSYLHTAKLILCSAYKVGLYGPKIVWIFPGWYGEFWWRFSLENVPCTLDQMEAAAEGMFQLGTVYSVQDEEIRGISNYSLAEFRTLLTQEDSYEDTEDSRRFSFIGPKCYDVTWAIGQTLHCAHEKMRKINHTKTLDQFTYTDADINEIITDCAYRINFLGMSGWMKFENNSGDPILGIKLSRFQDGRTDWIGTYNPFLEPPQIEWQTEIKWHDSIPPRDSTVILLMEHKISSDVLYTVFVLSSIGIALALSLLAFNVFAKNNRVVKMSSPLINNVLLIGCIVTYLTVFMQSETPSRKLPMCKARTTCFALGFTVAFGALFSKTWRVYKIFHNSKLKKIQIKDWHLLLHVACMTGLVGMVLILREVIDPQTTTNQILTKEIYLSGNDEEIHPYLVVCVSKYSSYFSWTIYILEGVLLAFGAFLAFETRKVKIEVLNDSHQIGICLYNVIILSGLGLTLSLLLETQVTLVYGITSGFIILGTTSTELILFVPKILAVKHNKVGSETDGSMIPRPSAANSSSLNPGLRVQSKEINLGPQSADFAGSFS